MNREEYRNEYLKSPEWAVFRAKILQQRPTCERCGLSNKCCQFFYGHGLDIHHLTYERIGAEWLRDVEVLCRACHELAEDAKREAWQSQSFMGYPGVIEFPCPECEEDTGVILFRVRRQEKLPVPLFWTRCSCTETDDYDEAATDEDRDASTYENASWYIEKHFEAIQKWRYKYGDKR